MTVHIVSNKEYRSLCGVFIIASFQAILARGRERWGTCTPTCDACILMHWAHPENTLDVDQQAEKIENFLKKLRGIRST